MRAMSSKAARSSSRWNKQIVRQKIERKVRITYNAARIYRHRRHGSAHDAESAESGTPGHHFCASSREAGGAGGVANRSPSGSIAARGGNGLGDGDYHAAQLAAG